MKTTKAWAILDISKKKERWCYAAPEGTKLYENGAVAIFFKKPKIHWKWKPFKKVIRITITS